MTALATVIRVSSLTGYPDCPRRSAARLFRSDVQDAGYTLRRTARSIGAIVGTAVHRAAAVALGEKATSGKLPPVTVAEDAGIETLQGSLHVGVEVMFDGPTGATHTVNEALQQTRQMVRVYHAKIAPLVNPLHIEDHFEADVAPGIILSGHPDIIAREPGQVRDLKTGVRQQSHTPQLGGYSLLARSAGRDIERAAIDFVQRVGQRKAQPDPVTTTVDIAHAETAAANILGHMLADLQTFRRGDPERRIGAGDPWAFMANPNSNLCSAKWCPAYGTSFCREGAAGK